MTVTVTVDAAEGIGRPERPWRPMIGSERLSRAHFHEVSDAVFAGVFLLRGMASATGRLDALSSRVVCDHVEALATRTDGDGVWVLAWNMTLDQTRAAGSALLARDVTMRVRGLRACSTCTLEHHRVDADHSDIAGVWGRISQQGQDWPDEQQWEALRGADRLDTVEPPRTVTAERPRRGPGAVRAADAGHVAARAHPVHRLSFAVASAEACVPAYPRRTPGCTPAA